MSISTQSIQNTRFFIILLAALAATSAFAIDLYLPALPTIVESLDTTMGHVQQTLSIFMLGVAGSQLIYGPLSDRFGRKPILVFGLILFFLASLLCALAQSVEQLIGLRLLQALGGGVGAVLVRAIVRDLYQGEQAAKAFSLIMLVMMVAPLVAPLIGGQLLLWFSWRSIFVALGIFAFLQLLSVALWLPETHPEKARRILSLTSIRENYRVVLTHRQAMGNFLCSCFSYAGLFAFITGSPFVYIQYFDVSVEYFGLLIGSNILMASLMSWVNGRVVEKVGMAPMLNRANWILMLAGSGVLFFAVTGIGGLWGIFSTLVVFIGTLGVIGSNTTAGMLNPFASAAGTASAILGAGRFLFGSFASMLVGALHDETPIPMAAVICTCGLLAFVSYFGLASVFNKPVSKTDQENQPQPC